MNNTPVKERWQPGQIVSLWDMLREYAELHPYACYFAGSVHCLFVQTRGLLEAFAEETTAERRSELLGQQKRNLEHLKGICEAVEMTTTPEAIAAVLRQADPIFSGHDPVNLFIRRLEYVGETLRHELEGIKFLWVQRSAVSFYENNQFDPQVQEVFHSCKRDMDQAGRCFALELYPACTFHLMRLLDAGLKRLCTKHNLTPKSPNWGHMLQVLAEKRDALWKTDPEAHSKWALVCEECTAIKNATRDPVSHSDENLPVDSLSRIAPRYDYAEATRILENTKAVMEVIAGLVS